MMTLLLILGLLLFVLFLDFILFGYVLRFLLQTLIGFPLFCFAVYWLIQILHDGGLF